jgi:hypothetical protein
VLRLIDLSTGMADDSREEILGLRFREDILRGVRLFAIAFAAILLCVAVYRILRSPSDVQGAAPDGPASSAVEQPSSDPLPDAAPVSETTSEVRPLLVPEPPPVNGVPQKRVARPRVAGNSDVPPPPPVAPAVAHTRRVQTPSGKDFESSNAVPLPVAPAEDSSDTKPLTPKQMVGYKSLIEANANRPPVEIATPPADDYVDPQPKGNRFLRAVGKIFHPGGKKEAEPLTLQPKQP